MIGLIGLIAIVYLIGTRYGDRAGVIATAAAVLLLIVLFCAGWSDHANAEHNWIQYWKRGGPNGGKGTNGRRSKARGSYAYDMRPYEPSRRELKDAAEKRAAYVDSVRNGYVQDIPKGPARVCHYCGRFVYAKGRRVMTSDGVAVEYLCPRCRMLNRTKIGA